MSLKIMLLTACCIILRLHYISMIGIHYGVPLGNLVESQQSVSNTDTIEIEEAFQQYKIKFNKRYKSPIEELTRFQTFIEIFLNIQKHNQRYETGEETFSMVLNHMSDWTEDERMKMLGLKNSSNLYSDFPMSQYISPSVEITLPNQIDWRSYGAVTEVKNQGYPCGSCFAFSATGALEGQWWKKTGKLVSLSEQQIVDCDFYDQGCHGGTMGDAYKYIRKSGGIESESEYKYISGRTNRRNDKCYFKRSKSVAKVTGAVLVNDGDEEKLKELVALVGPIAIGFYANGALHFYGGGILECKNFNFEVEKINHGALLVGYGEEHGTPYWLIKNSWGTSWGENGYFKLIRNRNSCLIAKYSVYPLV